MGRVPGADASIHVWAMLAMADVIQLGERLTAATMRRMQEEVHRRIELDGGRFEPGLSRWMEYLCWDPTGSRPVPCTDESLTHRHAFLVAHLEAHPIKEESTEHAFV